MAQLTKERGNSAICSANYFLLYVETPTNEPDEQVILIEQAKLPAILRRKCSRNRSETLQSY